MPLKHAQKLSAGKRILWVAAGFMITDFAVMAWAADSAPVLYGAGFGLGLLCIAVAIVGRDPVSLLFP